MMPGKIVRSNEILAHLGDNYYAWRTVPSAIEIIDRKKKGGRDDNMGLCCNLLANRNGVDLQN